MKKVLILALFLAGCVRPTTVQQYTTVGTIVGVTGYPVGEHDETKFTKKLVGIRTPDGTHFWIPFRPDQELLYQNGVQGEIHYHTCGADVYCFDYFKTLGGAK